MLFCTSFFLMHVFPCFGFHLKRLRIGRRKALNLSFHLMWRWWIALSNFINLIVVFISNFVIIHSSLLMHSNTGIFHETSTSALYVKILGMLDGNCVYILCFCCHLLSTFFCSLLIYFLFLYLYSKSRYFFAPLFTKHGHVHFIQVYLFDLYF